MSKLVFGVNFWDHDAELVLNPIRQLSGLYPEAQIIAISDGSSKVGEVIDGCQNLSNVSVIEGKRIKLLKNGGAWTDRLLKMAFKFAPEARILIKFDPDTVFLGQFEQVPNAPVFGRVVGKFNVHPWIAGGCFGITKSAAERVLKSGLLKNSKYSNPFYRIGYKTYDGDVVAAQDAILHNVLNKLAIHIAPWEEVHVQSVNEIMPDSLSSNVKAVHPWPEIQAHLETLKAP